VKDEPMTQEPQPPNTFPLDDAMIGLLAEFREQTKVIEAQTLGALILFIRQHGLQGNWQLAKNGCELVRAEAALA
jgi:hypothetical protein